MSYFILFCAIILIMLIVYSSTDDYDYDFRHQHHNPLSQFDFNAFQMPPPYYPTYTRFDPGSWWYEAEMRHRQQNFNHGFKVAMLVVALIIAAYFLGKHI